MLIPSPNNQLTHSSINYSKGCVYSTGNPYPFILPIALLQFGQSTLTILLYGYPNLNSNPNTATNPNPNFTNPNPNSKMNKWSKIFEKMPHCRWIFYGAKLNVTLKCISRG